MKPLRDSPRSRAAESTASSTSLGMVTTILSVATRIPNLLASIVPHAFPPILQLTILTRAPYNRSMRAALTSKGQITIPAKIRKKLGLKPGQVLDFDEDAPYLKAIPVFDADVMRSVVGCAEGSLGFTAAEWLDETRGPSGSYG